jgi:hypothetical protein
MYQTMKHSVSPHFSGGPASSPDEATQTSRASSDIHIQVDPGGKNRKMPDRPGLNPLVAPELTPSEENAKRPEPRANLPISLTQKTCNCWEIDSTIIEKIFFQLTKKNLSDAQSFKMFVSKLDLDLLFNYFFIFFKILWRI